MSKLGSDPVEILMELRNTDGIMVSFTWRPETRSCIVSKQSTSSDNYIQDVTWDRFKDWIHSEQFPASEIKVEKKTDTKYRLVNNNGLWPAMKIRNS